MEILYMLKLIDIVLISLIAAVILLFFWKNKSAERFGENMVVNQLCKYVIKDGKVEDQKCAVFQDSGNDILIKANEKIKTAMESAPSPPPMVSESIESVHQMPESEPIMGPAPAAQATMPSGESGSSFTSEQVITMLQGHNAERQRVGNQPLTWDTKLAGDAQVWAERIAQMGRLQHAQTKQGENLAYSGGYPKPIKKAIDDWNNEKKDYNCQSPAGPHRGVVNHYTQVVDALTKRVGCGAAKKGLLTYTVCRYDPAGNLTMNGRKVPPFDLQYCGRM